LLLLLALLAALALALPATAAAATSRAPNLYVSLGDSYAIGYQPTGPGRGGATRNGYADQLLPLARARGYRGLRLVNFGCGGATSTSMIAAEGCPLPARSPAPYGGRTQLAAAERYLRRQRGRVALVTVSIGGNDVTTCAAPGRDAASCLAQAVPVLERNVRTIVRRLRRAAGRDVRIVGLTYPNVLLGLATSDVPQERQLAELSVTAFGTLVNPALAGAYASARARFLDVTRATGGYAPLPEAAARICRISYFCVLRDIHLRTSGYREMARLIARALPRRTVRASRPCGGSRPPGTAGAALR